MQVKQYPFYIKGTTILLGLVLLTYSLSNLRGILTPIAFAMIIAILLNPLVNRFRKKKIPHVVSILLSMLIGICVISSILYFLSSQIVRFSENLPLLKEKFNGLLSELQHWLEQDFGMAIQTQVKLLKDAVDSSKALPGQIFGTALDMLGVILLIPVYVFLFLFYKDLILNFLYEVYAPEHSKQVAEVLTQTKTAIQSYMVGLLLEAIVVAILNSTALLILGVEYAILIGVMGALLNMLPYIGGLIAIALPVLIATMTKDGFSTQFGIIITYNIIQFIDNNILVPRLVSSKVQINALFSIFVVLLGGALWGISGMFLSIPFVAIVKIIFDRIDELKPWGKLLGDEVPTTNKRKLWKRKTTKPSVAEGIVKKSNEK
ncbi:MAG TPA: AI-2E family transporter [Sphingobacteriaceae bacterium]|nr:AI-2E family transporter [Sphingobacteriaceae bacterium]